MLAVDHLTGATDPVAEVELAELREPVGSEPLAGGEQLDPAGLVLEVGEVEPAVAAHPDDPAGQLRVLPGSLPRPGGVEALVQIGGPGVAVEADRVGVDPEPAQLLELGEAPPAGRLDEPARRTRPPSLSLSSPVKVRAL